MTTDTPISHAARARLGCLLGNPNGEEVRRIVVVVTASMRTMERELNVYRQREQEMLFNTTNTDNPNNQ